MALNAEVIRLLHSTLRALPRPLLEILTRGFRKRFQVPDTAVTITDRISQQCQHDQTRKFLVSHRRGAQQSGARPPRPDPMAQPSPVAAAGESPQLAPLP